MKKTLVTLIACCFLVGTPKGWAATVLIKGAGSTFSQPINMKWFEEYKKLNPDAQFEYYGVGSGAGIRQLVVKEIDFGATDAPMTNNQLETAPGAILHVPIVVGGVAIVYRLDGLQTPLKLSSKALAGIFLGTITRWNDPEIKKTNPEALLPSEAIKVIYRSESSGTTYCFTDYLSKVSPVWSRKVGKGTSVNWVVGTSKSAKELSDFVKQTAHSIGYMEMGRATQSNQSIALLQNKAGRFVGPSHESIAAAAGSATLGSDMRGSITDAPGASSYPISTFTYWIFYQKMTSEKARTLRDFLRWATTQGQSYASALGYVALPTSVVTQVEAAIANLKI
jgi:phosphate transport system substrate-binding protein